MRANGRRACAEEDRSHTRERAERLWMPGKRSLIARVSGAVMLAADVELNMWRWSDRGDGRRAQGMHLPRVAIARE